MVAWKMSFLLELPTFWGELLNFRGVLVLAAPMVTDCDRPSDQSQQHLSARPQLKTAQ